MMALATILPGPALADSPASPNSGSVMTSVGMEFPDMDDSIASVTKVYTSIEFPSVDDFDSLVSGGTAYVSLETANVDDYDSLVKQITVLELPSDSESVLPRPRTHQAPFLLRVPSEGMGLFLSMGPRSGVRVKVDFRLKTRQQKGELFYNRRKHSILIEENFCLTFSIH